MYREAQKSMEYSLFRIEDTLNLSGFLKGSQIKNGIHYQLDYPKGFEADPYRKQYL